MREREIRMEVGQRLQEIRGRRDQRTFAEAVDSVQQTISKYERGEIPRSWLFLARLVQEEGVDLNRLLLGEPQSGEGGAGRPEALREEPPTEAARPTPNGRLNGAATNGGSRAREQNGEDSERREYAGADVRM